MPKSKHPVPGRVRATYEFIKANQDRFSVQQMCRVLEVAPSGYYDWLQQPIFEPRAGRCQAPSTDSRVVRGESRHLRCAPGVPGSS
jgi:hypothetical protein